MVVLLMAAVVAMWSDSQADCGRHRSRRTHYHSLESATAAADQRSPPKSEHHFLATSLNAD